MFKNIMLAVDGSDYTDAVLSQGIALAKVFRSKMHILTVADVRLFEWAAGIGADGFVPIVPSGIYQDESRKLLEEKCDKVLEKSAKIIRDENIEFELEKLVGPPSEIIIERSQIADLLIIGKRGEFSRLENRSIGATVESVARNVRKPLIVMKKKYNPIKNILIAYDGSNMQ